MNRSWVSEVRFALESSVTNALKRILLRYGITVRRRPHTDVTRRLALLRRLGVNLVLDVGANIGQYALDLRRAGYAGRIVSFEPLPEAYAALARRTRNDPMWRSLNMALGDIDARADLNVSVNGVSSSFLPIKDVCTAADPRSAYCGVVSADVRRLDTLVDSLGIPGTQAFMKIDTQGFESAVLRGSDAALAHFVALELEVSLMPLYEDEVDWISMITLLSDLGFAVYGVEPGFCDPLSGRLLQADVLFVRDETL